LGRKRKKLLRDERGRKIIGFYKDEEDRTRPITKKEKLLLALGGLTAGVAGGLALAKAKAKPLLQTATQPQQNQTLQQAQAIIAQKEKELDSTVKKLIEKTKATIGLGSGKVLGKATDLGERIQKWLSSPTSQTTSQPIGVAVMDLKFGGAEAASRIVDTLEKKGAKQKLVTFFHNPIENYVTAYGAKIKYDPKFGNYAVVENVLEKGGKPATSIVEFPISPTYFYKVKPGEGFMGGEWAIFDPRNPPKERVNLYIGTMDANGNLINAKPAYTFNPLDTQSVAGLVAYRGISNPPLSTLDKIIAAGIMPLRDYFYDFGKVQGGSWKTILTSAVKGNIFNISFADKWNKVIENIQNLTPQEKAFMASTLAPKVIDTKQGIHIETYLPGMPAYLRMLEFERINQKVMDKDLVTSAVGMPENVKQILQKYVYGVGDAPVLVGRPPSLVNSILGIGKEVLSQSWFKKWQETGALPPDPNIINWLNKNAKTVVTLNGKQYKPQIDPSNGKVYFLEMETGRKIPYQEYYNMWMNSEAGKKAIETSKKLFESSHSSQLMERAGWDTKTYNPLTGTMELKLKPGFEGYIDLDAARAYGVRVPTGLIGMVKVKVDENGYVFYQVGREWKPLMHHGEKMKVSDLYGGGAGYPGVTLGETKESLKLDPAKYRQYRDEIQKIIDQYIKGQINTEQYKRNLNEVEKKYGVKDTTPLGVSKPSSEKTRAEKTAERIIRAQESRLEKLERRELMKEGYTGGELES